MSNTDLTTGTPQATEVAEHTKNTLASAAALQALEQQIIALQLRVATGQATVVDVAKLTELQIQKSSLQTTAPDPATTNITVPTQSSVGTTIALQDFKTKTVATPTPLQNNQGSVKHVTVPAMDLVTYINLTQNLNPWGRERQCDLDLKDLVTYINQDINAELGEWQDVSKLLTEITMSE